MILPIVQAPDARLRVVCEPVTEFDETLAMHDRNMTATRMQAGGIGLAGPQVGIKKRVVALNPGQTVGYRFVVNPEIIKHGNNQSYGEEGCLSVEGGKRRFRVKRWDTITVRFWTVKGEPVERILRGYGARVLQHEIDHLNGKLIGDAA